MTEWRLQVESEQKRKAEGKKAREDKDKVQETLYAAFEKHQYYAIRDLERITKQPIVSYTITLVSLLNANRYNMCIIPKIDMSNNCCIICVLSFMYSRIWKKS